MDRYRMDATAELTRWARSLDNIKGLQSLLLESSEVWWRPPQVLVARCIHCDKCK